MPISKLRDLRVNNQRQNNDLEKQLDLNNTRKIRLTMTVANKYFKRNKSRNFFVFFRNFGKG
jgi:hypothetical protein